MAHIDAQYTGGPFEKGKGRSRSLGPSYFDWVIDSTE